MYAHIVALTPLFYKAPGSDCAVKLYAMTVSCPFCGGLHYHGGETWEALKANKCGHRVSHCLDRREDYAIVHSVPLSDIPIVPKQPKGLQPQRKRVL